MSSEEEDLNLKRLMEQSLPFHSESHTIRDIYGQWESGKSLSEPQKDAFIATLNRLQVQSWTHEFECECPKHENIYVILRVLRDMPVFVGQDEIQYILRRGNVVRLPLLNAADLVRRKYADWNITESLRPENK